MFKHTKRVFIPVFALVAAIALAFGTSAFKDNKIHSNGNPKFASKYFHFIGTPGQEDDETKWEEITAIQYSTTYIGCNKNYDGCRLVTDSTQMIGGVLRPKLVEVDLVDGHKNPKQTEASGVTAVGLLNENP